MKKVKDWLEDSKKQFVIKNRFGQAGEIRLVSRIKDDAVFYLGNYRCAVPFRIAEFYEDCIHVKVKCTSCNTFVKKILTCRIDDIELSDDGNTIISWEGITDDGDFIMDDYTSLDNTPLDI